MEETQMLLKYKMTEKVVIKDKSFDSITNKNIAHKE